MDTKDLSGLTVYQDLITILKEKGFTDAQIAEIFAKVTAQVEMEVVEEMMGKLTEDQLKILDSLPDEASSYEIAEKVGINGEEADNIRAEKLARVLEEVLPSLNEGGSLQPPPHV